MAIKEIIGKLPTPTTISDKAHYAIIALLERGLKPLEHGRHRAGYVSKDYVYKVPLNREGVQDNHSEANQYNENGGRLNWTRYKCKVNIAKCRIIYIYDLPILVMEKVTPISDRLINLMWQVTRKDVYHPFQWIDSLDSEQAGFNKRGILVAYDYPACSWEGCEDYGDPGYDEFRGLHVSDAALTRYGNRKIFGRHSD
jgi:hypothetical protein